MEEFINNELSIIDGSSIQPSVINKTQKTKQPSVNKLIKAERIYDVDELPNIKDQPSSKEPIPEEQTPTSYLTPLSRKIMEFIKENKNNYVPQAYAPPPKRSSIFG